MSIEAGRAVLSDRVTALSGGAFRRLIIIAVILGFAAVMVAAGAAVWAAARDQDLTRWVSHSTEVQNELQSLRISVEQAEAARRGYLLTANPRGKATFDASAAQAPASVERLFELTRDNPVQGPRLRALQDAIKTHMASSRQTVEMVAMGGQAQAIRAFQTDSAGSSMRDIRARIDAIDADEDELLRQREAAQQVAVHDLYRALAVAAPLLLLVAVGSTLVIFRYTRDLASTRDALRRLNESLEAAVSERTASLALANDEIQRFAYIVSHDLRSPLVNILGFTAELETSLKPLSALIDRLEHEAPALLSAEATVTVREEVPEALGFIRKSTQKMDRLINAILHLSRSGRRTLKPERIELKALLSDVAATLKASADAAGAEVVIGPDLPSLVSDRLALEQIFSNLIENAIKYLKPGRPGRIEVRGHPQAGQIVVEVSDNGRGIDPKDRDRIFELFRRSGAQDRPGEGIGLAAVRASVRRLGGSILCDSSLDGGATFRVLLPAVLRTALEPVV